MTTSSIRSNYTTYWIKFLLAPVAIGAALFSGGTASAQFFTNENNYDDSSLSIVDSITFNGLAPQNGSTSFGQPGTLDVGGVVFTTPASTALSVVGPTGQFDFLGDHTATLDAEGKSAGSVSLTATLPTNIDISAVGTDIASTFVTSTITATVTLSDGSTATFELGSPAASTSGLGFLGYIAPSGDTIKSITFTDTTADSTGFPELVFDDFTYGTTDALVVPEPASLSLLALGAFGLFFFGRRFAVKR